MKTILFITMWTLYWGLLWRAVLRNKVQTRRDYLIWGLFALCFAAVSLWEPDQEALLDQLVGYRWPLGLWMKYCLFIVVCYIYTYILAQIPQLADYSRRVRPLWALFIGLGVIMTLTIGEHPYQRYIVIGVRDSLTAIYLLLFFLPGTHHLLETEQVFGMRIKHMAMIGTAVCFFMTAISSVAALIIALLNLGDPYPASIAWQVWIYPGVIALFVVMVPFNWLFTGRLERLFTYFRLRQLLAKLRQVTPAGTYPYTPLRWRQLMNAHLVDHHVYQIVMLINDRQSILEQADQHLYSRIHTCYQKDPQFNVVSQYLMELL